MSLTHSGLLVFGLFTTLQVMHWLGEMCEELQERLDLDLEMNNRTPRLLVFHAAVHLVGNKP